ncbi:putative leucine-rich repeat-containing protein DDB_G0290503 isoform X7 [Onthophagus taurus]|uniref:putative leucine-rich repeat-containing protein DDB_G0290503 isoform X7 n=1 Tax=Onthophagus taurus TaxID=166361 RepID=UPI0039BDBA7E
MNTTKSSGSISAYKSPTTSSNGLRKSFGPDGCPALVDGSRCGETKNLQIIKEFKRLYEDKMKQIDDIAGGDCIQAKVNLQQEWIKDLTDQNEMLVRVVEELEVEAAERVTLLEKKLHQSAKSAGEVMDSYRDFSINFLGDLQKMEQVQNDMNNLIELIRRAQTTGNWNTDGLMFYCLDINDVIPPCARRVCVPSCCNSVKKEDLIKQQEKRIKELEAQLKPQESYRKDYKDLEQSMLDMRDALTAEVADKHDTILCLRREVHMLEEQCRKADQQTHFKDDIIKELRKEIKQLKQQQQTPNEQSTEKIQLKEAVLDIKNQLAIMKDNLAACAKERDHYRREAESARQECQCQCGHIKELRNRLQSSMEQVHRIQEEKIQENEELRGMLKESFEENQNLKEEMDHGVKEYKQKIQDYCCCNEELNRQLVLSKSDVEECQCQILLLKKEKERLETCQNNDVIAEEDPKEKIARLEEQLRATLQQKEQAIEYERLRRGQEVENLKLTIQHMEHAIKNKQANSENLQCAVDLYNDSISVLEQSKLSYETQITQQQMTITNLQDALIITKKELEELRIKFKQDHEHKCDLLNILDIGVYDLESSSLHYHNELKTLKSTIEVLTEENLNLEITKFEINQDKTILETTLFNYKQEEKRLFEFINNLKEEISRLKHESRNDALKIASLQNEVTSYLTQSIETKTIMKHILGIGDTEDPTIDCDCSGNSLTMTAQEVERFVQTLQSQINLMLASIEREQNLSQVNAGRIDELQNILSLKNMELARSIEMYDDLKEKLDDFACRNKKLQDAVIELRDQLVDTELDQQFHEQKVDYCHDELDNCLKNLNSVKCRLNHQTQEMTKKIEELQGLKTDFKEQNNTLEKYKRELDGTKIKYRDEVLEMKRVIKELNEKLNYSDLKVKEVTEELKGVQEMLVNMTQRETKYQQELTGKDQDLNNKCQVWKVKETRLMEQISQLEQQLRAVHNELAGRTHQIDSTKSKLQQVTNDAQMRMQMTQEELITAKNEINCLRQINEKLQIENENLHQTVCSLQSTLGQHESLNITIKKQLDKCMCDLKKIESDKYFVEQKNEKLLQELDKMQSLLRCRCENVMTLEEEINDIKSDRDEIRRESQHVICNVRAWLEEQKRLNDQLKDKLVKKNALIIKYQQSSSSPIRPPLKKSLPPVCAEALNRRQRGGTTAISSRNLSGMNVYKRLSSPQRVWSLNSKGSDTEDSPRSSICSDSADWFDMDASETTTTPYDEPGTAVWIQRVESMTEELQKTNRYWKKKISDNEKEEERLKKTKET